MSTLGAQRIKAVEIHFPAAGQWWASVVLSDGGVPAPGAATLTLADLPMPGTVLGDQSGFDAGDLAGAIVVGGNGWLGAVPSNPIPSWQADGGLPLYTVLQTLVRLSGEPTVLPPAAMLQRNAYALAAGQLRAALSGLVAYAGLGSWWVDPPTGKTLFGARTGSAAPTSLYSAAGRNLRRGVRRLALVSNVAPFLPGSTVEGVAVARLVVRETGGKLAAEVWF